MKLTITNLFAGLFVVSSLQGCGAFSDETRVEIQMYGVATAPAGAVGDRDPQFQTYKVQSIVLNASDGNTTLLDTEASFKIVDRPQILISRTADDYKGKTYTGMTVVFAADVTGGNSESSDLSFTLTQTTVSLAESITISEGKTQTFAIKAAWANTIGADVMTEPALSIKRQ